MRNIRKKGDLKLVSGLIFGVIGLVLLVIIGLMIVTTILNANLMKGTSVLTTRNESGYLNSSAGVYTLAGFNAHNYDYTIVQIRNATGGVLVTSASYTFNSALGTITNSTAVVYPTVNITYTQINSTAYEDTATGMAGNLTTGTNNVSDKIPTILLIAAVVLLLGILVFLVVKARQMNIGGGANLSNTKSSGRIPEGGEGTL